MATTADPRAHRAIHPLHAVLLAGTVPLFLGGMFSDLAYASSYQVQWTNFASWLIAGALVFTGLALLGSFIELLRGRRARGWPLISCLVLLAMFVLGLINSFVHARDAWGSMPEGLVLSTIAVVLALVGTWVGFATLRAGGAE